MISTRVESTISTAQSTRNITIGKVLKCGHAFHEICIRRYFNDRHTNCPNCRAPVAKEDRDYDLTEDPAPPEGFHHYYSTKKGKHNDLFFPADFSPEKKQRILDYLARKSFEELVRDCEMIYQCSFNIPVSNNHAPAPPSPPLYMDPNGVAHQKL